MKTIASAFRHGVLSAVLGLSLVGAVLADSFLPPAPLPPAVRLQDVAQWDAYGLGNATLAAGARAGSSFSGKLHVPGIPDDVTPDVIGFKADNQQQYNLALIYPARSLVSLLPGLRDTAVAEMDLPQVVVMVVPAANAGATVVLPPQVGSVKMPFGGGVPTGLQAGAKVMGHGSLGGDTATLLQTLGLPSRDLAVSGRIDPRILSGVALRAPNLQTELINSLELRVALGALNYSRRPAFLAFGDAVLVMRGVSGRIAAGVATSLTVNVGPGIHFDSVAVNRDPASRQVTVQTASQAPNANFISLPVDHAAITEVFFKGTFDEQNSAKDKFLLAGKYTVGGSTPRDFTATLSGGSPAQYVVSVQTDTTLGQLMGWSAPGLDALVLKDVVFGNGYILGNLSLKGLKFTAVLFKAGQQAKYNVALLSDETIALSKLKGVIQATPLGDLDLVHPGFVLVPPENVGKLTFPDPVAKHVGLTAADLKNGLNLIAHANTHGDVAALLNGLDLAASNLVLTGNLDPAILAATDAPLGEAFIDSVSLELAIPGLAPRRKPAYVDFGDSVLMMKGVSGKIAAGIATSLRLRVGTGPEIRFNRVAINRDPVNRLITITSVSQLPNANFISLPIDRAAITEVAFNGVLDEQNSAKDKFLLAGKYTVGGSTPRDFTATLSGGSPAQYVVSIQTDTTLAQLMGWSAPGLDLLVLRDVVFGNGYILGDLSLKGLKFTAVLFKAGQQAKYNVAFLSDDTLALPKLMAALTPTPLADLELTHPGFVLVPQENAGKVAFPDPVAKHLGLPAADLKNGLNLITHANALGETGLLLRDVNLSSSNLLVTGNLDTAILSASESPLGGAFIDSLSLQAVLPKLDSPRKPPYLAFGDSVLAMKGVSGKIAAGIATSLTVNVGPGLRFTSVVVSRDPVNRQVVVTSTSQTPGANFISLPIDRAAITEVAFNGVFDEQNSAKDKFLLAGKYTVGGSTPRDFTATLSGGSPAQYVVSIQADTTLGQLLGWSAPGLDALALKDVVFGNGYILGDLSLKGLKFTAVLFKAGQQAKYNVAFLSDDTLSPPKLMSALQGTPLGDLDLAHPGFILVPKENAGNAIRLPEPASRHVGVPTLDLKAGLNLVANGNAYGDVGALLQALGIDPKQLPITGTLDPSILSGSEAAALAQPFLDALDLKVTLRKVSFPGLPAGSGYLALKGMAKGIDATVAATMSVDVGGGAPLPFDASMRLVKAAAGNTVSIAGQYAGAWNRVFGLTWLNLRDVRIAGSQGPVRQLAVVGTTDIGPVRNLTATFNLLTRADGVADKSLELSGADIALSDIPSLSAIPHLGDLKFRNLIISTGAIGGTLKSNTLHFLDGLEAVAFEHAGSWNLAALLGDTDFSKLVALPAFARPVLGNLKLGKANLMFSQLGVNARLGELPRAVQVQLAGILGSLEEMLRLPGGMSLVSLLDPASLGPAVTPFLPAGQKLVLQGGIGGVAGGGAPSLALSATIPSVSLPSSLAFVKLPSNARTALFVNLNQSLASCGVGIEGIIATRLNRQTVNFDAVVGFQLDRNGGVTVGLTGKSLDPWRNAMGINGFSIDPGATIELKTAASSELTLGFAGKTHIGTREADVAGKAGIIGGVVDRGAFEAKLSELTLADLVALFNDAVAAGGGQRFQVDFPAARLTNVDAAFATPGFSLPDIGLPAGGMRVAGDLWFLLKDKPLSRVKAQISDTRMAVSGDIGDFSLGPVALKGNMLDIQAQTSPPLPPLFKIRGNAAILNKHIAGLVNSSATETEVVSDLDLGGLLKLDLHASFDTPVGGLDAGSLASQDLALNAHLTSDIGAWLRTDGKKAAAKVFDSIGGDIKKLVGQLDTAQKAVDSLSAQIAKARARATGGAKTVDQQIAMAQKKVDDLAGRIDSINRDIASEKGKIDRCDYSVSVCYWWNWRGHCTKHKDVPDVARDAACEAENGRHAATIAAYEATLKSAQAAKLSADAVLAGLKRGEKGVDVASLDPEVVALEASQVTAEVALQAAKAAAQGAELGADQLAAGLRALDLGSSFNLTGTTINGSFRKAVAGKPVVLGLEFEALGKPQHLRLALSLTDPAYNTRQFETLALLVAKTAVESQSNAAPVVKTLLNDAFKSRHDAADKEVAQAAQDNGLQ